MGVSYHVIHGTNDSTGSGDGEIFTLQLQRSYNNKLSCMSFSNPSKLCLLAQICLVCMLILFSPLWVVQKAESVLSIVWLCMMARQHVPQITW